MNNGVRIMERSLKDLITAKGYNIKSFAEHIGIPPTTIYNVCTGGRDIDGLSHRNYQAAKSLT
jgi:predicted transcriptional regulator